MKPIEQLKIRRTQELMLGQDGKKSTRVFQAVELTHEAVEAGFLKDLPGSQLSVYLYLLTHVGPDFTLTTSPLHIASLVPYTPNEVDRSLKMLDAQGYISLQEDNHGQCTIALGQIPGVKNEVDVIDLESEFDPTTTDYDSHEDVPTLKDQGSHTSKGILSGSHQLSPNDRPSVIMQNPLGSQFSTLGIPGSSGTTPATPQNDAVAYILRQKAFSDEDLVRAITAMIPSQLLTYGFRQEVEYWFKNFDKEVLKELVRRTDEARQRDSEINCQAYMRKIAAEWIQEQIFTLEDLENSDRLYRETRSLIEEFGIDRQKDTTRTHWETISRWINCESADDFALSVEVARFAIQSAILRKSDGRPSLTYIEDNYIKPFKEHQLKTIEEAREFLKQRSERSAAQTTSTEKQPNAKAPKSPNKWQTGIDFTRFREN